MMTPIKTTNKLTKQTKEKDAVQLYMSKLNHPLLTEIEALRSIIKAVNKNISERIKWNAPSYYYRPANNELPGSKEDIDFLTFNLRDLTRVHLIFHHAAIVQINSPLLEGDYKDRRMVYFTNISKVRAHKKVFRHIIHQLLELIEQPSTITSG